MELKDTVELMLSEDYEERFKAEYWQLKIRYNRLKEIISKYETGTLKFTPKCCLSIFQQQASAMEAYLQILEERAQIEDINLDA